MAGAAETESTGRIEGKCGNWAGFDVFTVRAGDGGEACLAARRRNRPPLFSPHTSQLSTGAVGGRRIHAVRSGRRGRKFSEWHMHVLAGNVSLCRSKNSPFSSPLVHSARTPHSKGGLTQFETRKLEYSNNAPHSKCLSLPLCSPEANGKGSSRLLRRICEADEVEALRIGGMNNAI